MITLQQLNQIKLEAREQYPYEAVWLLTSEGLYQVENTHENPLEYFRISDRELTRAWAKDLKAIIHSHPGGHSAPSSEDMKGQINTAVAWAVIGLDEHETGDLCWWGKGVEKEPLVGRGFRHGVTDCYGLIKDYYDMELGIQLPEFPRDWDWWQHGQNLFTEGFAKAGFVRIEASEAKPNDVWLAQIRSDVPNHGGILLEGELAIHQMGAHTPVDLSRPSVREPVHRYRSLITHWLRYTGGNAK